MCELYINLTNSKPNLIPPGVFHNSYKVQLFQSITPIQFFRILIKHNYMID